MLPREAGIADDYEWTNPLSKTDDGLADETVLLQFSERPVPDEDVVLTMLGFSDIFNSRDDNSKLAMGSTLQDNVGKIFARSPFLHSVGYASEHIQTNMPYEPIAIKDVDGDGVEDNVHLTADEIDSFYIPNYFNTADEIYNTHHGNLPGHRQLIFEGQVPNYKAGNGLSNEVNTDKEDYITPWEDAVNEGRANINEITDQGMNSDDWANF